MKLNTSTDPQVGFRPPGLLEAATALQHYDGYFTVRQAAHLARRAGFGTAPGEAEALRAMGMQRAVDSLLHPSGPEPDFADFPPTDLIYDPKTRNQTAKNWWLDRMLRTRRPLIEKMTLFWHNHFATSMQKVPAAFMVEQINLFRRAGMGNFRQLLLEVSRDPAMLIWLDNRYNVAQHPNENYAREVMELFALGLGNYTEDDIHEAARAFTGWSLDKNNAFVFNDKKHDDGSKTFLGKTGDFDGTDIINIIVTQPVHQRFICRKLLEAFVYSDPEDELIEGLAQVYALSGYDIAKTVGTILRSNVFYSARAYRALPKSPIEFTIGLQRYMQLGAVPADTIGWLARMGQNPLEPPSVKGWDGGPTWINTSTLLSRFNYVNRIVKTAPPKPAPATMMSAASATPAAAAMLASPPAMAGSPAPTATPVPKPTATPDPATFPSFTPDTIVRETGGFDPQKILAYIVTTAVQDDVTRDVRETLIGYLNSTAATVPVPLGPENYEEKIRGALALVLNLPSNQLD